MKIAIIGAGFTGLSAGYRLSKVGYDVTIFESEESPGGLAIGFKEDRWDWTLEHHYHHWFTNDDSVLGLSKEIEHEVITARPKTSTFIDSKIYQFDSPLSLLRFDELSFSERLRTGFVLGYLKLIPSWKPLERVYAKDFLVKFMGNRSWEVLWKPLFEKKFGKYAEKIPASWFWARIKKRTPSLAYPAGGFQSFVDTLADKLENYGANIIYNSPVDEIKKAEEGIWVKSNGIDEVFDKVIVTLPSFLFTNIAQGLPEDFKKKLLGLKGLGAVNLVLSLNEQFLKDGTYWLNINEMNFPFLAVVEHTNFMNKKHYNNEHLLYVGNYLDREHEYFNRSAEELVEIFLPYLKKINPHFNKSLISKSYVFDAPFAQPIIPLNYSDQVPEFITPIKNVYLANMQQVYPWDRGTNYAVELGEKVSELIRNEK